MFTTSFHSNAQREEAILVSFYGGKSYYREKAEALDAQLRLLSIDYDICEFTPPANFSWPQVCKTKISFYASMMQKHRRPIFWVDIDTTILSRPPILEPGGADFGAFLRNFKDLREFDPYKFGRLFHPGYLLFNCSPAGRAFVYFLEKIAQTTVDDVTDDYILQEGIKQFPKGLTTKVFASSLLARNASEPGEAVFVHGDSGHVDEYKQRVIQHGKPRLSDETIAQTIDHLSASLLKEKGIPRLYLQHAEITENFPPLDFELSLLHNELSKRKYLSIGRTSGGIRILPRHSSAPCLSALASPCREPVKVVVYTSTTFTPSLNKLLRALSGNPLVAEVGLKAHPRANERQLQAIADELDCPLHWTTVTDHHVAIVPNSSVCIELLHRGIPTFYSDGLDNVGVFDYHGFVGLGILPSFSWDEAEQPFWRDYHRLITVQWEESYALANPSATPSHLRQLEERQFMGDLSSFLGPEVGLLEEAVGRTRSECLQFLFAATPRAFFRFVNQPPPFDCGYTQRELLHALIALFESRSLSLKVLLADSQRCRIHSAACCWLRLRSLEWNPSFLSQNVLRETVELLSFLYRNDQKPAARILNLLLISVLLKTEQLPPLARLLKHGRFLKPRQMSRQQKIGFLQKARVTDSKMVAKAAAVIQSHLSPFEAWAYKTLTLQAPKTAVEPVKHQTIEQEFGQWLPTSIRQQYTQFITNRYAAYRRKMKFMDVRFSRGQETAMFNIFECSLKRRTGFSLIRLSDGEGYIFCNDSEFFTHLDALNRERHWWGAELAEDLRSDLLLHLRKAVSAADVVGIPSVYRFVRDVSPTQNRNLLSKVYLRGLCAVLHGAGDLCRENVLFTEEKCNECLFKEPEQVMRLAKHARQTFLVTSLKPKAINAIFGEAHPYLHIPVSTHARHCINDDYLGSESPIVLSHAKVSETLRRAIHPGDLVLVGAGLVGKLFVHEAKQCGAVAIDIGSSFDRWLWTASKTRLTAAFL